MPTAPRLCYLLEAADLHHPDDVVVGQAAALAARGFGVTLAVRAEHAPALARGVPVVAVPHFGGRNLPQADCYIATSWTTAVSAHGTGLGIGVHLLLADEAGCAGGDLRAQIDMVNCIGTVKLAAAPHLAEALRVRYGQRSRPAPAGIDAAVFHARGRVGAAAGAPLRIALVELADAATDRAAGVAAAVTRLRAAGVSAEVVRIPAAGDAGEAADALRACDIAVLAATTAQDSPVPALRAMACGCATVLTGIPAFRGIDGAGDVADPRCMFVPQGDADAMAAALGLVAAEPGLRAGMARAGAALAARSSWDLMGGELDRTMRELIEAERDRWLVFDERMVPGESDEFTEKMHRQRYEYVAQFADGRRVLDVGCGSGCGSQTYALAGAASVHAIDRSAHALDHARRHFDHPVITWNRGDFFEYDGWPRGTEELAVCLEVFEHVDNPGHLMGLIVDALADHGRAIVSTPNRLLYSPGGDPVNVHHEREYELDEFAALLGAFFGRVDVVGQWLEDGVLTLGPPEPRRDLMFIAVCSEPIRSASPAGGVRVVGVPDWDVPDDWRPLVDTWCRGLHPDATATLALAAPAPDRAGAALLAVLEGDGIDPGSIPDIEVSHGPIGLRGLAPLLRDAALCVPMGADAERQRRLAECFGVACADHVDRAAILRGVAAGAPR